MRWRRCWTKHRGGFWTVNSTYPKNAQKYFGISRYCFLRVVPFSYVSIEISVFSNFFSVVVETNLFPIFEKFLVISLRGCFCFLLVNLLHFVNRVLLRSYNQGRRCHLDLRSCPNGHLSGMCCMFRKKCAIHAWKVVKVEKAPKRWRCVHCYSWNFCMKNKRNLFHLLGSSSLHVFIFVLRHFTLIQGPVARKPIS